MRSKFLVIILVGFSLGVPLARATGTNIVDRCADALIGIKPRLGLASSRSENFDVRVVSKWGAKSRWTNKQLLDTASNYVASMRKSLANLGFGSTHFINVLVEKHPGATHSPVYGDVGTSLALGAFGFITTPNIFGMQSLFFGNMKKGDSIETMHRVLLLMALTSEYNSVFSPFSIAHELAHDTEVQNSPRALIWIEARADFLAYAVTGESQIFWPGKIGATTYKKSGEMFVTEDSVHRSLSATEIRTVDDLIPNKNAYHENSQLISSFLFRLGSQFGIETPLNFIKWMDQQPPAAGLELNTHLSEKDEEESYGPVYKQAWREVANCFFDLFLKWNRTQANPKI